MNNETPPYLRTGLKSDYSLKQAYKGLKTSVDQDLLLTWLKA